VRLSRGEVKGPHQLQQKRSLALVLVLQSLAAAEVANALHLRDFRSPAIFEFFNTISQKADISHIKPDVRFCSDCVAKVFLRHATQILRAVGATIE
jgi:hypothetical protein